MQFAKFHLWFGGAFLGRLSKPELARNSSLQRTMTGRKILQFAVRTLSPLLLGVMQNHSMWPERALQDMGGAKQISLNIYQELSLQSSP